MKIKTITCHDVYNHGASLQAYALQNYLQSQGHETEIIDYKPDYLSNHYRFGNVANPRYNKPIIKWLYLALKTPSYLFSLKRRNLFDLFREQYLKITSQCYHTISELRANPPEADLYVVGSDQVWNTSFPNGKDAAFYLDFAKAGVRRASYAASFATATISEQYHAQLKHWIERLDYVSIREEESLGLLKSLGIEGGTAVVDPVFLLSRSHWEEMAQAGALPLKRPYALVYAFEKSPVMVEVIARMKELQPQLTVYELSPYKLGLGKNINRHAGPLQFLYLIRNADIIVSNSFHASAFALIFERNFCVTGRFDNLNVRMHNLMNQVGLPERYVIQYEPHLMTSPDFIISRARLHEYIQHSKAYLGRIIKG